MSLCIVGQGYSFIRAGALFLVAIIVSVLVGFRPLEVGTDTLNYYQLYWDVLSGFEGSWREEKLGYVFYYFSVLADYVGGDASYLTFFYAALTCYFIFHTFFRYSVSLPVSVAYFFTGIGLFFFMHNVMRQALAISMVFYSVHFMVGRNWLKFSGLSVLAVLTHASALFFVPFYFLARLPIKGSFLMLAWLASLPFIFMKELVVIFFKKMTFLIPSQYVHYLEDESMYERGGISGFGLVFIFKQVVFLLVWLAYRKDGQETTNKILYLLSMFAIIFGNFFLGLGLIGRFNEYLLVFVMLALPAAVREIVKKEQQGAVLFLLWMMLGVIFIQNLVVGTQGVVV